MKRLIEKIVFSGFVTAWRLATWPTSRSPSFVNATTDGVVRPPSELGITVGESPSRTATTELVVPRSIPTTLLIAHASPGPVVQGEYRVGLSVCQAPNLSLQHSMYGGETLGQ